MTDCEFHHARTSVVTAALLVIGDEILSGRTKDKNIGYIAEYLTAVGIDLMEVRVVGDEEAAIVDALNALRHRYTYVFTTGGIGPTHDDITADCVAKAFGVSIDVDPRALAILQERVEATGTRDERSAPAHDAHSQGRRPRAQQGVGRARHLDRQRHRHGGRAVDHAGDARRGRAQAQDRHPHAVARPCCADAREGDIGSQLGEIAKANPEVAIGSYPFFDPQHGPNTNVVLRARDAQKLAVAKRAVEDMLERVRGAQSSGG